MIAAWRVGLWAEVCTELPQKMFDNIDTPRLAKQFATPIHR